MMPTGNTLQSTSQAQPAGYTTPASTADPAWQFWAVTIVAAIAALWILAKILPKNLFRKTKPGVQTRATLTVQGKPIARSDKSCSKCH